MSAVSRLPALARLPVLGALLVFSLIVLGIDAHLVDQFSFRVGRQRLSGPAFPKLGVAVAVITLVSVGPMVALDIVRKGVVTSFIGFELAWLFVLWVLWLAAAGSAADFLGPFSGDGGLLGEAKAGEAFAWLSWIILFAYWVILLVYTAKAYNGGNKEIWRSSVSDHEWSSTGPVGEKTTTAQPQTTTATGTSFPSQQPASTYPPGQAPV